MTPAPIRLLLVLVGATAALALTHARSCGYDPPDLKGEGEACTRTDECESGLECRGAVCMIARSDAGPGFDAGHDGGFDAGRAPSDAGQPDTGAPPPPDAAITSDAGRDASFDSGP